MQSRRRRQFEPLEQRLALSAISLVADINGDTFSSESTALVRAGDRYLFKAVDATDISKLYEFDPVTLESQVLKDLNSAPGIHGEFCDQIVSAGDQAFFFAIEGSQGILTQKLWVSDGTADGTRPIMDVGTTGRTRCIELSLSAVDDVVYFQTSTDLSVGIWRSDGTADGTREIVQLQSGGELPELPVRVGERDVFFAPTTESSRDWDLWATDGTTDGTQRIAESVALNVRRWQLPQLVVGGTHAFVSTQTVSQGAELLVTDGTQDGTRVIDVLPGLLSSSPSDFHQLSDGRIVFSANDGDSGRELWQTDGSADNTSLVRDILAGPDGSEPKNFWQVNNVTYFEARTLEHGSEIWRTDGTADGTVQVKDTRPGITSGGFKAIGNIPSSDGDLMLFTAKVGSTVQLWSSDGTDDGIRQLSNVRGEGFTSITAKATIDGVMAFGAYRGNAELWFTDGTSEYLVNSWFKDTGNPNIDNLQGIGNQFFFTAEASSEFGDERYISDGTDEGTRLVSDINQRSNGSFPQLLGQLDNGNYLVKSELDNALYGVDPRDGSSVVLAELDNRLESFALLDDQIIFEVADSVWASDGTVNGTNPLMQFDREPTSFNRVGDFVFFRSNDRNGPPVWRTDGTVVGTVPTAAISIGDGFDWSVQEAQGKAFFTASNDDKFFLWSTDGSPAGLQVVTELTTSNGGAIAEHDNRIFFLDKFDDFDPTLFVTDGTFNDRTKLLDQHVRRILLSADVLYFEVRDSFYGSMLWRTDGTNEGTFSLDVPFPGEMVDVNGQVYFISNDFNGPRDVELWKTDGTAEGTEEIKGVLSDRSGRFMLHENNGSLVIFLEDGVDRIFESDGTAAGTKELSIDGYTVTLIREDLFDSSADGIYFTAQTFETGGELFRIHSEVESHPKVVTASVTKSDANPLNLERATFQFDGNVGASLQARDLKITTKSRMGLAVDTALATMIWDPISKTATWDLTSVDLGYGNFSIELDGQGVFDEHNNSLDGNGDGVNGDDFRMDFDNLLVGDLDLNRTVDFADFLILSGNFGQSNATRELGDLNGDRKVGFADFLLLSSNFGAGEQ